MPADITGTKRLRPRDQNVQFRQGPVFARFSPRRQDQPGRRRRPSGAAGSDAGAEVTVGWHVLPVAGRVQRVATQNPVEQEGTYPLPEAQLDRFMMKLLVVYPDKAHEIEILRSITPGTCR